VVRAIGCGIEVNHACGLRVIVAVEEEQVDARAATGEQAEVDATVNDRGAEGRTSADLLN
jgi:hypothetical protein